MPKKKLQGVVISDKMDKTVVVSIEKIKVHPIYKKRFRRHMKCKAHDELGAKVGDVVSIVEHRPISKEKRWLVKEIVNGNKKQKGDTK